MLGLHFTPACVLLSVCSLHFTLSLHFTPDPQSAVCVLLSVCSLHFTLSLHFIPGPQSAVHSPQSAFYTDRFQLRKKWKYIRGLRLPGLSLAINSSRPHYLARRKSEATGVNNDLIDWGGTRDLRSVEYKNKKSIVLPTTPERIPGPKIKSQNSSSELLSLKNSLRHKGIPETIKLGNKNNNQDINPLLKIRSPKALITLNAQINPPLHNTHITEIYCAEREDALKNNCMKFNCQIRLIISSTVIPKPQNNTDISF